MRRSDMPARSTTRLPGEGTQFEHQDAEDPVEPPAREPRHCRQIGEITLDELDARRWRDEIPADVHAHRCGGPVVGQLRDLGPVAAPGVQDGESGDVPEGRLESPPTAPAV